MPAIEAGSCDWDWRVVTRRELGSGPHVDPRGKRPTVRADKGRAQMSVERPAPGIIERDLSTSDGQMTVDAMFPMAWREEIAGDCAIARPRRDTMINQALTGLDIRGITTQDRSRRQLAVQQHGAEQVFIAAGVLLVGVAMDRSAGFTIANIFIAASALTILTISKSML
jgi:hypothetical protein